MQKTLIDGRVYFDRQQDIAGRPALEKEKKELLEKEKKAAKKSDDKKDEKKPGDKKPEDKKSEEKKKPEDMPKMPQADVNGGAL